MMSTVPHVTSGLGLRKFQADGFLLTRVYMEQHRKVTCVLKSEMNAAMKIRLGWRST